jgi:hypothetical protein
VAVGDPGPYMNDEGGVWVPRTVPYLQARKVAAEAIQDYGNRLRYIGKVDATLFGFTRDCQCEEACALRWPDDEDTGDLSCQVPSWEFEVYEP